MHQEIQLLTEKQLADRLNVSIKKLQKDRQHNQGIPYIKLGKSVRYRFDHIDEYLNGRTHSTHNIPLN